MSEPVDPERSDRLKKDIDTPSRFSFQLLDSMSPTEEELAVTIWPKLSTLLALGHR